MITSRQILSVSLLVASTLLSSACFAERFQAEGHCSNRSGDDWCRAKYGEASALRFCSNGCPAPFPKDDDGCRDERPAPDACYSPCGGRKSILADDSCLVTAEGSSSAGESESSTEGVVAECTILGRDDSCPDARPFCEDGSCLASCADGGVTLCPAVDDGETPRCHEEWGECVGCLSDGDCADGQGCNGTYACAPCFEHHHCPDSSCDASRPTPQCMDEYEDHRTYYVDDCTESGRPGTEEDPKCSLAEVAAGVGHVTAWLKGGTHEGFSLSATTLTVIGVGDARIVSTVTVGAGGRLHLANLTIASAEGAGLEIVGSNRAVLHDVRIESSAGPGIAVNYGDLRLYRSVVVGNAGDGITATNANAVTLWSSIIGCNGTDPTHVDLRLTSPERVDIRSTTVGNPKTEGRILLCTSSAEEPVPWTIRNSIFVSHEDSIDCTLAAWFGSVVDTEVEGEEITVVKALDPSWFADADACDLLLGEPLEDTPLDTAIWDLGDPRDDIDRVVRTPVPGARQYAGADQP